MLISFIIIGLLLIICSNFRFGWDLKLDIEFGKMLMFCEFKGIFKKKIFFKIINYGRVSIRF